MLFQKANSSYLKVLLLTTTFALWGNLALAEVLCPGFESKGEVKPGFTDSEKLMLCGKSSLKNTEFKAWSEVPISQASLHLRAFLESRGYLNPKIEIQNDKLVFDPGAIVRVSRVEAEGAPEGFNISRRRNIVDKPLTPSLLSGLENWVQSEMQRSGYPCPRVKALAEASTGRIVVQMDPGEKQKFGPVFLGTAEAGFNPENLTRYYAFTPDQEFNRTLLQVTEDRTISEGLVEQTKFVSNCTAESNPLHQVSVLGAPRILSYSFMASTEVIAELQANYRLTRMDSKASYLDTNLTVSARLQQLSANYRWYFGEPGSSQSLRPMISLRHQDEHPYALDSEQAQVFYMNHWDTSHGFGINFSLGPNFEFSQMRRGPLEGQEKKGLALQSELEIRSFTHEVYRQNIYQGYRVRLAAGTQSKDSGSDFSADTLKLDTEILSNLSDDSPPTWMGAWRLSAATTSSPTPEELPPTYRQYLGGIDSLRGFERLQVPTANEGSLTRLSTSFELRTARWSETIWPLAFYDIGWLGNDAYQLDATTYQSPGIGLYWKSPIGPVRATAAFGEASRDVTDADKSYHQWQFYLSLGEQF